uniref:Uncharacterized protein n=1 Tax=viral metagenome TaxID=1070528 RepID=A0A6C0H6F5_9ZZZZ
MSEFDFDFELVFTSDFDQAVLDASGSPHAADPEFQQQVQGVLGSVKMILQLQPGINLMSTYLAFTGTRYKVTLTV